MPSAAVNGMATSARPMVISSEGQAEPLKNQPLTPFSIEKAVRKYSSVGVLSRPIDCTKPPTRMMP